MLRGRELRNNKVRRRNNRLLVKSGASRDYDASETCVRERGKMHLILLHPSQLLQLYTLWRNNRDVLYIVLVLTYTSFVMFTARRYQLLCIYKARVLF